MGHHTTITIAGASGSFQLNVMLPLIAYDLLESIALLTNVMRSLADDAVATFVVKQQRLDDALARNPILVTALNPVIGYEAAAKIAKEAYASGAPIKDVVRKRTSLEPARIDALLDPAALTRGGVKRGKR
jgi:fumarate hydratase class II